MLNLTKLRERIDKIDYKILELLRERCECVDKVGKFKKENSLPVVDSMREKFCLNERIKWAKKLKICPEFISKFFREIFNYSYQVEEKE